MIKIDLHTHSIISPDGGISAEQYEMLLTNGSLDCIAITDHNRIDFALELHKKLGNKIIVGEEIMAIDGEIIGLFLKKPISSGLTANQTISEIHKQNGLVYIPHPLETFRKGLQVDVLEKLLKDIDIFEVFNGRGLIRGKTKDAEKFVKLNALITAASSDAHGFWGIGKTFSIIKTMPTKNNLKNLLKDGDLQKIYAPLMSYLYPFTNRIKNRLSLK